MLRIIRNKVVEEYLPTYLPTYLPACLPISASFSSTARVVVVIIIINVTYGLPGHMGYRATFPRLPSSLLYNFNHELPTTFYTCLN